MKHDGRKGGCNYFFYKIVTTKKQSLPSSYLPRYILHLLVLIKVEPEISKRNTLKKLKTIL